MLLLQEQALHSGIYRFQCPLCRDRVGFIRDLVFMGIRIPFRLVFSSQLLRCEGTRAVLCKGLSQLAWPFAAINVGLSITGKLEQETGWRGRESMG